MLFTPALRLLKSAGLVPASRDRLPAGITAPGSVKKADDEQRIVWGEVYAPGFPDSQGDYMDADGIKEMAYAFMHKSDMHEIDVQHDQKKSGAYIVESFVARDDDQTFIPGSWVLGVHIPDDATWGAVKKGELNGFSLDGFGQRNKTVLEIEMPEILAGRTLKADEGDHDHEFEVQYSPDGKFMGGRTNTVNGHYHDILRGTVTEDAGTPRHNHRFDFIEGVLRHA